MRSAIDKESVLSQKSETVIGRSCNGPLPMFLTALLSKEMLTRDETEELKKLFDNYTEV